MTWYDHLPNGHWKSRLLWRAACEKRAYELERSDRPLSCLPHTCLLGYSVNGKFKTLFALAKSENVKTDLWYPDSKRQYQLELFELKRLFNKELSEWNFLRNVILEVIAEHLRTLECFADALQWNVKGIGRVTRSWNSGGDIRSLPKKVQKIYANNNPDNIFDDLPSGQ